MKSGNYCILCTGKKKLTKRIYNHLINTIQKWKHGNNIYKH